MKFSKDYVLFCHITTQIAGEKYGNLLEEKGGEGWPFIVFMDGEGNVLAVHEEDRTAEAFAKTGQKAKGFIALKAKADGGDKSAQIDLAITQLSLGQLKADEAEKRIKAAGPATPEQLARFEAEQVNVMVTESLKTVDSEDAAKALGKKFYERQKAGKPGPSSEQAMQPYYILMLNAADEQKDAATFEVALKALQGKFGSNPRAKAFFEEKAKHLEALKAEKK